MTATSLLVMPALGIAKKRLGATLGSGATAGWSWLDPAIALLLAAWAIREGAEAWHGRDCC